MIPVYDKRWVLHERLNSIWYNCCTSIRQQTHMDTPPTVLMISEIYSFTRNAACKRDEDEDVHL